MSYLNLFSFIKKNLSLRVKLFFLILIIISIFIGTVDFAAIYLLQNIDLYEQITFNQNNLYILLFFANFVCLFFFKLIHIIINRYVLVTVEADLSDKIISKNSENTYIDTSMINHSSLINLITFESKRFTNNIIKPVSNAISNFIILVIIVCGLLFFGYFSTIIIGGIVSILLVFIYLFYKKKFELFNKNLTQKNKKRTKTILDTLDGSIFMRSFNLENYFDLVFYKINKELKKVSFLSEIYQQVPIKFVELLIIIIIFFAYLFSYKNDSTVIKIDFLVYFYAFYRTYPTLKEIFGSFTNFQNNKEAYKQINEFLMTENPDFKNKKIINNNFRVFRFVNFSVWRKNKKIINKINFEIYKNNFIGISGKSGAGKSSLALAISGLIGTISGELFIDKKRINSQDLASIRRSIIYLSEKPFIISNTLKENLFKKISSKELTYLLKIFSLKNITINDFINKDKDNLSYGQKQKIAVIRAILFKPKILVLDEALNGIDIRAMDRILLFLKKSKITVVLITHNVSVLKKHCSKIIKL